MGFKYLFAPAISSSAAFGLFGSVQNMTTCENTAVIVPSLVLAASPICTQSNTPAVRPPGRIIGVPHRRNRDDCFLRPSCCFHGPFPTPRFGINQRQALWNEEFRQGSLVQLLIQHNPGRILVGMEGQSFRRAD